MQRFSRETWKTWCIMREGGHWSLSATGLICWHIRKVPGTGVQFAGELLDLEVSGSEPSLLAYHKYWPSLPLLDGSR